MSARRGERGSGRRGRAGRPKLGPRLKLVERSGRAPTYYVFDGARQESTGTSDRRQADLYLVAYLARTDVEVGRAQPRFVTIGTMFERWWEECMDAPDTERVKRFKGLEARLRPFWGDLVLSDLHTANYDRYCETRENLHKPGTRVSSHTARNELKRLRTIIVWFCKANGISPVPHVVLPPRGTPRVRWLWRDEVARLICAARGRVWDDERGAWRRDEDGRLVLRGVKFRTRVRPLVRVILIGSRTGTRENAIFRAGWEPSATRGHIDVTEANFHRRGEAEPETRKRRPTVRMDDELLRLVRRWARADAARGFTNVIHDGDGRTPAKPTLQMWFAEIRGQAGLGPDVTLHTLRHTCATWLLAGGASLEAAADYLGLTVRELERTYAQVDWMFTTAAADALNEWGRPSRPLPKPGPAPALDAGRAPRRGGAHREAGW